MQRAAEAAGPGLSRRKEDACSRYNPGRSGQPTMQRRPQTFLADRSVESFGWHRPRVAKVCVVTSYQGSNVCHAVCAQLMVQKHVRCESESIDRDTVNACMLAALAS